MTKGGPADGKLEAGDLVLAVNGEKVTSLDQLTGRIRPLPDRQPSVTVKVRRDGHDSSRS